MAIPKLIHQTHSSPHNLDSRIQENIKHIRSSNPDHRYQFYSGSDREDFIRTAFGANMLATYSKLDPAYGAARADFFRYLLISI
jgi:mannosyltransferase OCH1-like enzyme